MLAILAICACGVERPLTSGTPVDTAAAPVAFSFDAAYIEFEPSLADVAADFASELAAAMDTVNRLTCSTRPHMSIFVAQYGGDAPHDGFDRTLHVADVEDFLLDYSRIIDGLPEWAYRGAVFVASNGSPDELTVAKLLIRRESALSLSPVRFAPAFNTDAELRENCMAAGAFLEYAVKELDCIPADGLLELKAEFAAGLPLPSAYDYPYDGLIDDTNCKYGVYVASQDFTYPLVLDSRYGRFFVQPLRGCEDADAFERFFYDFTAGLHAIRSYIEENALKNVSVCNFDASPDYYFSSELANSYASRGYVSLSFDIDAALHETMHQWLFPVDCDHWYYEGMAEFLPIFCTGGDMGFIHSMARHALEHPELYGGRGVADINGVPSHMRVDGDWLTYDQSCSLCFFIADHYGLDPLLELCAGVPFELALGIPFDSAFEEWSAWLYGV